MEENAENNVKIHNMSKRKRVLDSLHYTYPRKNQIKSIKSWENTWNDVKIYDIYKRKREPTCN